MEKVIFFPKNEFHFYNEGKRCFGEANYKKAAALFKKAGNLKYLRPECIKYQIDCHIELQHFEEVYKMIENEFVENNLDEEYLLKKYLYTMVLDGQYIEADEIIKIYEENNAVSADLKVYLSQLKQIISRKLTEDDDSMREYLTSDRFEDHIKIILNLEQLDYNKFKNEIERFLLNEKADGFVKYSLLKFIFDNAYADTLQYVNYYGMKYTVKKEQFKDILNDESFNEPIETVLLNTPEYPQMADIAKNIWLDFCVKHYPEQIENKQLRAALLHVLLLKSLNIEFNVNDICKRYNVNSKALFEYFDC